AHPLRNLADHINRGIGMVDQKLLKVIAAQAMKMNIGGRSSTARSLAAVQNGEFAKKITRLQFGQRHVLHVVVVNPDANRTFFEDVKGITPVVFVEDRIA